MWYWYVIGYIVIAWIAGTILIQKQRDEGAGIYGALWPFMLVYISVHVVFNEIPKYLGRYLDKLSRPS